MKKLITLALAVACLLPTVSMAQSTIDDAVAVVQQQIIAAYYAGDQQQVAELFTVLLEIIWMGGFDGGSHHGDDNIEIETRDATNIEEDEAVLRADIEWNDADRGYIWFEYGEDRDDLDWSTGRASVDDDDDDYRRRIDDLDEDERYYFRAVIKDRDSGKVYYGDIESFYTEDDRNNDEVEIDLDHADDVTDDSAELSGSVDMNDFRNGIVFFVWGEDEDQVEDIADDYTQYQDIDEDGDDLQVYRIDRDLDGRGNYTLEINGLDDETEHHFSLCVEYEDEDNDEIIVCADTKEFETED